MRVRVGTRGSSLARIQTGGIVRQLVSLGLEAEEVIIETLGDRDRESRFAEFGGAGVFVREIEEALLDGRIDAAVHSYKDLPSGGPEQLVVAAVPERLDPADHLLVRADALAADRGRLPLPEGARVGTSSARRRALLLHERDDLQVDPLRGNVDTRIRKLVEGRYEAIVLAGAGLQRLRQGDALADLRQQGVEEVRLAPEWFVPAPAQGALAIQTRRDDTGLQDVLRPLQVDAAARSLIGERRLLARVEGNCDLPFGAWCCREADAFSLSFALGDDERLVVGQLRGDEPRLLADRAWDQLRESGMAVR